MKRKNIFTVCMNILLVAFIHENEWAWFFFPPHKPIFFLKKFLFSSVDVYDMKIDLPPSFYYIVMVYSRIYLMEKWNLKLLSFHISLLTLYDMLLKIKSLIVHNLVENIGRCMHRLWSSKLPRKVLKEVIFFLFCIFMLHLFYVRSLNSMQQQIKKLYIKRYWHISFIRVYKYWELSFLPGVSVKFL